MTMPRRRGITKFGIGSINSTGVCDEARRMIMDDSEEPGGD
jgi:hypothetical protein